jgi:parallel beta-helix repeat protein
MGIMVSGPAERVSVTGNSVRDSDRHGIALVNGVLDASVTGNVVEGSSTGVYLRDSSGEVKGNTIQQASAHGVSFVGAVDGSEASFNILAGRGESALDTRRADGDVTTSGNNDGGWHDTTPWWALFKKLLQPMTALWTILALLIVTSALRGRRSDDAIRHPYAHQMVRPARVPAVAPWMTDLGNHRPPIS